MVTRDPVVVESSPETEEMSFKSAKTSPDNDENFLPQGGVGEPKSPQISIGWFKRVEYKLGMVPTEHEMIVKKYISFVFV